jgi:o-succinylbenzoate synthase
MTYQAHFEKKTFLFKQPSGTSRGVLTEKHAWFIYLKDQIGTVGVGECSIIPGLSPDFSDFTSYELKVGKVCEEITHFIDNQLDLILYPSILFGLEQALLDLDSKRMDKAGVYYDTPFTRGEKGIPINGLIWMGSSQFMLEQIEEKLAAGFSCLKMKIGAIDFVEELNILRNIRNRFSTDEIELRVDANGAFSSQEALEKLNRLSEFGIHSIEQPIAAGQLTEMNRLCLQTPIPIALDEELIGIHTIEQKRHLLSTIQPQYIILKPSLHGGIVGSIEWINVSEEMHIPWWITSALESNVGLNAIAQFASTFDNRLPQGLGTGGLYVYNEPTNLFIQGGSIYLDN